MQCTNWGKEWPKSTEREPKCSPRWQMLLFKDLSSAYFTISNISLLPDRSCVGQRFCLNAANLWFVCIDYYDYVFLRLRSLPGLFLAITIRLPWTAWVRLTHLLHQVLRLRNAPEPKKDGRCLQRRLFSCGPRSSVPRKSFAVTTGDTQGSLALDPPTLHYWPLVWKSGRRRVHTSPFSKTKHQPP